MINIYINGQQRSILPGKTILEACKESGIHIPTFCYDERLKPEGSCRICVVELEDSHKLLPACTTEIAPEMRIATHSPLVMRMRKHLLEIMLSNHDISCLKCERAGNCLLQDYAYEYDVDIEKYRGRTRESAYLAENKFFELDQSKCISCGKCARICSQLQGNNVWAISNRGFETEVSTPFGIDMEEAGCVHCGNCVSICPVGALKPKKEHKFRAWEINEIQTTCSYCGVGCQMYLQVKDDKVVGVKPAYGKSNEGLLCVKGKFAFDFINHPQRLTTPLLRLADGELHSVSWEEALQLIADKTQEIKNTYGADAIMGLSSARVTNEENYLFMKYMRAVIGTNNLDHCARL